MTFHDLSGFPEQHYTPEEEALFASTQHTARAFPNRARQFMPFAALKGFYDLIEEEKRVKESRHENTEEEIWELSQILGALKKGDEVKVTYYDTNCYVTAEGVLTSIDTTFKTLTVVNKRIYFEDLRTIEVVSD